MENNLLSLILSSQARSEVFRLLFDGEDRELYFREMERLTSVTATPLKKELAHLLKLDLIIQRIDGNRTYYRANKTHPIYQEIHRLTQKTVGIESLLQDALSHTPHISTAFIFGSIAEHKEKGHSDIDLFIIGEISLRELVKLLSPLQKSIGREINPHIYSLKELKERIKKNDHFITSVIKTKKTLLRGSLDDIERITSKGSH